MTDEAWYVVRNTSGVTGFIGSSGGGAKPFPLAKHEVEPILKRMGIKSSEVNVEFGIGDEVVLLGSTFAGKTGRVDMIDQEKEEVRVLVDMFGGSTPVTLDLSQVEKAKD